MEPLAELNGQVEYAPYLGGYAPSAADAAAFAAHRGAACDAAALPHAARWLAHMASFDDAARAAWAWLRACFGTRTTISRSTVEGACPWRRWSGSCFRPLPCLCRGRATSGQRQRQREVARRRERTVAGAQLGARLDADAGQPRHQTSQRAGEDHVAFLSNITDASVCPLDA